MALVNTFGKYALDDKFLKSAFKDIIDKHKIETIVETGIHEGRSTLELSYMVKKVIGIEILAEAVELTRQRLKENNRTNFDLYNGNSPEILKEIMPLINAKNTIFFLDAHWQDYWPINDEIRTIPKKEGIIIVHDFFVPSHPEFGYDSYHSQPFTYEFIKDSLTEWSDSHRVVYNEQVSGSCRGVGFIFPE